MHKPFLFDRDNLRQVFAGRRQKELLQKYGYTTLNDLYTTLITQKSPGSEYIIGLPGAGKTTFAVRNTGAKVIETKEDIKTLLTLQFETMIFVTSDVEDEIAQNAKHITLIHTSPERIVSQRQQRDEAIQNQESETSFGRSAGTVAKVTIDDSIIISRLTTDYADKSRMVVYKSKDFTNREEQKNIQIRDLHDKRKYVREGVVTASGKWAPAQIVHIEKQLKQVLSLSQEKGLAAFAIIGQTSGGEYDLGLTQNEKIRLMDLVLKRTLSFIPSGTPKFIKNTHGKVIKIVPEKSRAILGKERLPDGFTQGSYEELKNNYPDFFAHKDAYSVKGFAGYNFINIGTIPMEGSEESISATYIRKCLVEGNIEAIRPYLSPEIFLVLTSPHNLRTLQRRYVLIQERDQKLTEKKDELIKKYKQIDPLTKNPLLNKQGNLTSLTKTFVKTCKNRRDESKVMTYLEQVEGIMKKAEKSIKKKYHVLIYAPENILKFE